MDRLSARRLEVEALREMLPRTRRALAALLAEKDEQDFTLLYHAAWEGQEAALSWREGHHS